MIVKGRSRGDGGQLAAYVLDQIGEPKNDAAEMVEVRGFFGRDLRAMFRIAEDEALANTRGSKPLYHGQIAPAPGETLTAEQALEAVEIMERHLGFQGLDRAVFRHTKNGEDHWHVVWSRYDRATGELRAHPHDARRRLEAAAEIEERFDLRRLNRGDPTPGDMRTHAEHQQDARASKTKAERAAEITALWQATDSGRALRAGLEAAGYTLARGERGFVVVDQAGEIHSLARQIDGAKKKDVDARLADLDPSRIPDADAIRAAIKQAAKERQAEARAGHRRDDAPDAAAPDAPYVMPEAPRPAGRWAEDEPEPQSAAEHLVALTRQHSTFTLADLQRHAAKATGFEGRAAWMAQTGGVAALDAEHRASAERSYERWAEANERLAAHYDLADYVSYAQKREAERRGGRDPEAVADQAARAVAAKALVAEIIASPEFVELGPDRRGRDRFTTRAMLETEMRMEAAGADLAERRGHGVKGKTRETALRHTEAERGITLGGQQRAAFEHVTGVGDLALVVGYAGTGKSTMLRAARAAWEAQGLRVSGTAVSGIAAQGLEDGAGIRSRNLRQLLHRMENAEARQAQLDGMNKQLREITSRSQKAQRFRADLTRKRDDLAADLDATRLTKRDMLVVDEAGMIGSRDMEKLLVAAREAGAKVVLVGDAEQLQSIEAGGAFRALQQRHGAAEITEVQRQAGEARAWQREATRAFAEGGTSDALAAYRGHGMTHEAQTRDEAKAELVAAWSAARRETPGASQIILAHTRADVADLNRQARASYAAEGRLGQDQRVETATGALDFAAGDRLYFTKNDTRLNVKNGTLATVEQIVGGRRMTVRLDSTGGQEARRVTFDVLDYGHIAHGYAATVHKSQGVTVDRAFVLATGGMDRHAAYVGMSRHRDRADLYHAREDFRDFTAMSRRMARDGKKDTTLDYLDRGERSEQTPTPSLRSAFGEIWQRVKEAFGWHRPPMAEPRREATPTPTPPPAPVAAPQAPERPKSRLDAILGAAETPRPAPADTRADRLAELLGGAEANERERAAARLREQEKRQRGRDGPGLER